MSEIDTAEVRRIFGGQSRVIGELADALDVARAEVARLRAADTSLRILTDEAEAKAEARAEVAERQVAAVRAEVAVVVEGLVFAAAAAEAAASEMLRIRDECVAMNDRATMAEFKARNAEGVAQRLVAQVAAVRAYASDLVNGHHEIEDEERTRRCGSRSHGWSSRPFWPCAEVRHMLATLAALEAAAPPAAPTHEFVPTRVGITALCMADGAPAGYCGRLASDPIHD